MMTATNEAKKRVMLKKFIRHNFEPVFDNDAPTDELQKIAKLIAASKRRAIYRSEIIDIAWDLGLLICNIRRLSPHCPSGIPFPSNEHYENYGIDIKLKQTEQKVIDFLARFVYYLKRNDVIEDDILTQFKGRIKQ